MHGKQYHGLLYYMVKPLLSSVCACGKWVCTDNICNDDEDESDDDEEAPEDDPDVQSIRWF